MPRVKWNKEFNWIVHCVPGGKQGGQVQRLQGAVPRPQGGDQAGDCGQAQRVQEEGGQRRGAWPACGQKHAQAGMANFDDLIFLSGVKWNNSSAKLH